MSPVKCLAVTLLSLAVAPGALAQEAIRILPGETIQRELLPGEKHSFDVDAAKNTIFRGKVDKISTDVVVKIFAPRGRLLASFDGPGRGAEEFSFFASGEGSYRIDVTPFNENEPGTFVITLDGVAVPVSPLVMDHAVDRTMTSGDQHHFRIDLEAGDRALGDVMQVGMDFSVEVWSPDGRNIGSFNNRARGPEPFGFTADSTGVYLVRVIGEGSDQVGSYTLTVRKKADPEFDDGSSLKTLSPSSIQVENLALLGRVWGFLKYHHPAVTSGQYDWDHELFRALLAAVDAPDRAQGMASVADWATSLGEPPACDPCAVTEGEVQMAASLDWLKDEERLGARLSRFLTDVRSNRHARGSQYYVKHSSSVGNPIFQHEAAHAEMEFPDAGYRLLALFRFWNMVEYWFPNRDIIGEDWGDVLTEFVPRLLGATDADEYKLQMLALIVRVHDTHARLWPSGQPPTGNCSLPAVFRFVEGQAVVTAVAESQALAVGDVIQILDGASVPSLVESWSPLYSASNGPTRLRDIGRSLRRGECGPGSATIHRGTDTLEVVLERLELSAEEVTVVRAGSRHDLPGDAFQLLSDEVAYLKISSAQSADTEDYLRRAQGTRGMVIDIRNYPSSFTVFELGQHLVADTTAFVRFTAATTADPGTFSWGSPLRLEPAEPRYLGRIVILVDDVTQSSAEYHAMAFRAAPGALVVGSTTAGADGNVSSIPLPGGLRSLFSGIGVFYPDKSPTQRIGIVPDIFAEPTISGIREGRDEVLEAALREILGASADEAEIRRMASHDR